MSIQNVCESGSGGDVFMHTPNNVICAYLKKRDTKGLEYLFAEYYKPLVLWADTFLNDIGQAEDLVQEFFVKLWEQDQLAAHLLPETLKSYLYASVRNRALNLLDKNDPLHSAFAVEDAIQFWEEYSDSDEYLVMKVEDAVKKLPPRSREVVECVYLKNMKYKEVAEKLDISVATVKTLLVNSLKTLRKELKGGKSILLFFSSKKMH